MIELTKEEQEQIVKEAEELYPIPLIHNGVTQLLMDGIQLGYREAHIKCVTQERLKTKEQEWYFFQRGKDEGMKTSLVSHREQKNRIADLERELSEAREQIEIWKSEAYEEQNRAARNQQTINAQDTLIAELRDRIKELESGQV